ncbi:beta strand repeat-containing protein [Pseudochelatococcus sp. G4_1912]|uniref:beta strand repeat-containing protein n=1 Tax=Pseudochelatococcus sp. G4_1912 TaxID=3114288 RepID=UPI0039C6E8B3
MASSAFSVAGNITKATLTIATAGTVTTSRVYDGTTAAAKLTDGVLGGVLGGDSVTLGLTGTAYNSKDVATANTITGTYVLGGASAGNYQLASSAFSVVGNITPVTLTIATAGTVTTSRVYDGTTAAAKLTDGVLGAGVIGGDSVTLGLTGTAYNSKDVATANTITGTYVLGGASAGNYQLASSAFSVAGNITPVTLTIATAGTVTTSRVYDGTTAAAKLTDGMLGGVIGGDSVTLGLTGTAYNSKDVATANTITGTYVLGGASAGNYQLASSAFSVAGNITKATLTIATAGTVTTSRVYDGTTAAAKLTDGVLGGVLGGDSVTLGLTGTAYNSQDVATANTITGTYVLGGASAGNYQLASSAFSAAGNITPVTLTIATQGTVTTSRVYDGTTAAAKLTDGVLGAGVIGGDSVTLGLTGTAYNSKDVATANAITGTYVLGALLLGTISWLPAPLVLLAASPLSR